LLGHKFINSLEASRPSERDEKFPCNNQSDAESTMNAGVFLRDPANLAIAKAA